MQVIHQKSNGQQTGSPTELYATALATSQTVYTSLIFGTKKHPKIQKKRARSEKTVIKEIEKGVPASRVKASI